MIPVKQKVKLIIKPSQVPLTSYKGITKPKKAPLSFKFVKTQIMSGSQDQKERKTARKTAKKAPLPFNFVKTQILSGSQDQKERKTASTVTTIFFEQKITTARIRFCNTLTPQKSVARYFKDVETEETFSSQDQKQVETTNL